MKGKMIITGIAVLALMNCASSRIVHSWKSPGLEPGHFNKILVAGLFNKKDSALREKMENHLVNDLHDRGFTAVSSYKVYGSGSFEGLKEEEVLKKISDSEIDGIMTIVLMDKKSEQYYDARRMLESPDALFQRRFWGYYSSIYDLIYDPGYYDESTSYFWQSNFYDMRKKELIYSVQTKSFDPKSTEGLAHEYGKLILKNMAADKILN